MLASKDDIVVVHFEIDRRDLFRANMDLAKWRLLVAVMVVLALILPLGYFFIMIGEQTILLQTSPLFVALPLVALGGQVLRMRANSTKYVSSLSAGQRQPRYTFKSSSDGYDSSLGESFAHTAWKDVMKVVEKPTYFLIYLNRFQVGILPKRGFQPADLPIFRAIVRTKLNDRGRVAAH